MRLDNSRSAAFKKCPDFYRERYVRGIERNWTTAGKEGPFDFGKRIHQLLEVHNRKLGGLPDVSYPCYPIEAIELEAQTTLARYVAAYPVEPFDVVAVEQLFEVPLNGSDHTYIGKMDGVIRYQDSRRLAVLEHKSEKRNSNTNSPLAWAAKAQVSLYKYAAEYLYKEPIAHILLDVLERQSPKGQEPARFRRDILERTDAQVASAIDDLIWVADRIEELERGEKWWATDHWPRNTDNCCQKTWQCAYFDLHVGEESPQLVQLKYQKAEEYLGI